MAERWAMSGMGSKGETPGRFGLSKHTTRQSCVYASLSLFSFCILPLLLPCSQARMILF